MKVDPKPFHDAITAFLLEETKKRDLSLSGLEASIGTGKSKGRILRRAKNKNEPTRRWTVADLVNASGYLGIDPWKIMADVIAFAAVTPEWRIKQLMAENWRELRKKEKKKS